MSMEQIVALSVFAFAVLMGMAFAGGIGTSTISVNSSSVTVSQGHSASVAYTVKLASGSTWGTMISANDSTALEGKGITLKFSNSYMDPTYSGVLMISISSAAVPGNYTIGLIATGDDPSTAQTNITLMVPSAPIVNKSQTNATSSVSSSIVSTTVPSTTISSSPASGKPSSYTYAYVAIAMVIIVVIIVAALLMRRK